MKRTTKKAAAEKVRLTLDSELIADLEADGDGVKGGQSGSGSMTPKPPTGGGGSGGLSATMGIQGGGRTGELNAGC